VVAVEQDQENGDSGGQQKQPIFREHIGVQQTAAIAHADFVLSCLVDAVEWGKVDVGGCLVDAVVVVGGSEDTRNEREVARA
jgi:hypothetical protein